MLTAVIGKDDPDEQIADMFELGSSTTSLFLYIGNFSETDLVFQWFRLVRNTFFVHLQVMAHCFAEGRGNSPKR